MHSIDIVQARLLVALFEVGHAINPTASISIAGLVKASVIMGLDQAQVASNAVESDGRSEAENALRTWWAVIMLDRYQALETGSGCCAREHVLAQLSAEQQHGQKKRADASLHTFKCSRRSLRTASTNIAFNSPTPYTY